MGKRLQSHIRLLLLMPDLKQLRLIFSSEYLLEYFELDHENKMETYTLMLFISNLNNLLNKEKFYKKS